MREDITREHAAQAELAAERSRLDLATEAADLGIWDWDRTLGTITLSARARAIFGLSPDQEVPPARLVDVIHPEDRDRMRSDALRALDPRVRSRDPIDYRVIRADGEVRWLQSTGRAIFEDGPEGPRAVRYLGAMRDVTVRRASQEFTLLGIDPSTPPGALNAAWLAAVHPEDRKAVVARTMSARVTGEGFTQDYRVPGQT